MKKILLAVLSIAALASCMQDENLSVAKDEAIVFENAFVDNATKAIDPSITTTGKNAIKEFQVWGTTQGDHDLAAIVPIFENEKVEGSVEADIWGYAANKTQYWIAGNKYNFAAVVNGQNVQVGDDFLPKTIEYTANGTTDLLYARSTKDIIGKESGNGRVGFTFSHLLSKAVFSFENTSTDKVNNLYVVENITITGLHKNGVYTVGSGWAFSGTETIDYSFGNIVEDATESGAAAAAVSEEVLKSNFERLIIPGTHTVTISCTIKLYLNGDATTNANLAHVTKYSKTLDITLAPRTAYNFALSAGLNNPIEFKVNKVNDWGAYKNL